MGRCTRGQGNQGGLLGRGREGQTLKVGEELETDGKPNSLERTESEVSVRETGLGPGWERAPGYNCEGERV